MNKELIQRIYEEIIEKIEPNYRSVPGVAISSALEIIDDSNKYGVALLPKKATENTDKRYLKWQAKRALEKIHTKSNKTYYDIDEALSDLDEFLLSFGVTIVNVRKNYE